MGAPGDGAKRRKKMSSAQPSTEYEKYYVPESSSLAVRATIGLVLTVFGGGLVLNEMTFGGTHDTGGAAKYVMYAGLAIFIATLTYWFRTAIKENKAGLNSSQLSNSYVLGMFWFIFSEVMFFAAFFGALLYVRTLAGPWLAGEGDGGRMNFLLWEGFEYTWPPLITPQEVVGGALSQPIANNGEFVSQHTSMAFADAHHWYAWLPLWNTIILLTSSVTCEFAHRGLAKGNIKKFEGLACSHCWFSDHLPVFAGGGVLRSLRVVWFNTQLRDLRFNVLYVDGLSRISRRHGYDDVTDSVDSLG
jgi:cytochrome c oxidase subunit 3